MMWIMRLLQHGVKGIINIIDFFVSFLFDNDNSSSSTSLTTGSTSSFKQHQSGSNLAALEALPPHFHRQHQAVHNQNISHIALSLPLQSTPQPSAQHPPYPHNHHGATYNQRHVLFHRKKSDDYDHFHSTTYQYHGENHTPTIHADNAREGGSSMMTHDQSVFFSVDDQQYQVWKQLNQNVHSNPVQRANNTPTAIEYDSSFTPISGSIHIDIDRLASIQQQAILPTATATNLQHNTTNVHRRGSKNIHVVIPPTTPLHPTPSTTTIPAAYPGGPGVAASGRLSTASPEITKRKVGGSSPSQNSSQHPDNHNIGVKPQHHHPIVIDTVPSMLQKQISGETQTVSQQMSNDSTIATLNRGIRGSQPLVRLNRLTLLEAAKTPPQTNSFIKKKSNDLTSSSIFSMDVAKMSLLLPIISFQDLIGADDKRNRLGGGAFGQVYRGVWKGTPVAIKILSSIDDDFQQYDGEAACDMPSKVLSAFEEEVTILAQLRHPNICLLLGVCVEQHRKAIVTELVSRGSLWDALRQKQSFQRQQCDPFFWPLSIIRKVLEGAGRGLAYLHSHNPPIVHRDLKSANILLDESFNVKICDFGLAKLRDLTTVMTANVGTVQWMAPEVLVGNAYDESVDIFSMALVCWEMLTGKCPYEGMKQVEVAIAVINHQYRPAIPALCSAEQKSFLQVREIKLLGNGRP